MNVLIFKAKDRIVFLIFLQFHEHNICICRGTKISFVKTVGQKVTTTCQQLKGCLKSQNNLNKLTYVMLRCE